MENYIFGKEADQYLRQIIDIPTPSGFEQRGQELFKLTAEPYVDSVTTDVLGNVIALKKGKGKQKLMITAHMDEIGFMVKYIDDSGMLYIVPIGGVDMMLLPGLRLIVHYQGNSFLGIVGRKPIHLLNEMERKNINIEDAWLDLGFTSKKHAQLSVAVGSIVTFGTELEQISVDFLVTHSADNKIGGMILLEVMRRLQEVTPEYDLYFVSSVQEEIGLRGSMPATSQIEPDKALVIDATHATDYPSTNLHLHGDVSLGGGPVLCISPDTNREFVDEVLQTAVKKGISCQLEAHPNASGTEARAVQLVRRGTKTGIISYPVRYMHSPSEMIAVGDIQNVVELIVQYCMKEI